ncbi:hypothetical protein I307_03065 [Cryptococcus deuterogattii 99/473]|uniref:FUN14 domain-containing protein n=2 Tax=Cryptococcus deuterogattii TaxID=1859096 RepID=A0A0D0UVE6_9TREE|nr:hypothetical protein CNBG_5475 [Cryptococcus deuterogattii R265]KIR28768.1 hypothetical protein I309_02261 [Cryptococcus deuterogattii LA55]KIR39191.1 hypothetical protein I313_04790 [Cryptococcus deuterogattii Ram5]KIR71207.1 hypothetical protein I310_05100 [Cryptococcus deuterogattii CA1014]KIR94613.1 hypothetical protein I304_00930 [Cryptococcus deuterogattii CBS 10090]KIS00862.1 hypothetical protein L804_02285 [Cryptococcus deuterogattii 2001/935-1]KIY57571.1 hypothetical protein I307_
MSFRPTLFTSFLHAHAPSPSSLRPLARSFHRPTFSPRAIALSHPAPSARARSISPLGLGIAASLTLTTLSLTLPSRRTQCMSGTSAGIVNAPHVAGESRTALGGKRPKSIVSAYELSFGAVCGICAGIFIKKGAKAIAFLLGGAFVFLQYLSTKSYIQVDWAKIGSRYDSAFGTKTHTGAHKGPTIGRLWARLVDFLTADFQQRASFLAGLALGIRLG